MNPQRAQITGPHLDHVPGMVMLEPHVGDSWQLFLENGKVMRTSAVRCVSREGNELIVDTENSRYHVELRGALAA